MKKIIKFFLNAVPRKYLQRVSGAATKTAALFYVGNNVECPVCGRHFRKFLPYGYVVLRENALCPGCMALERHRLLWLYFKEQTPLFYDRLKVLHIAPEHCFLTRLGRMENLDYITADLESPLAAVKMDIQQIPFGDNTFDVVICNHILEHVDDDLRALSELFRVMKPGGWAVVQSPVNLRREATYEDPSITSEREREKHFGQKDHVREYGADYPQRLARPGFEVVHQRYAWDLDDALAERYALVREIIYIVKKPV